MVVTGLRDGYGIADPAELVRKAWDRGGGDRPMDLSPPGLERED